ncbi:MAG: YciI family protein [Steroidobacteraceae bacterium]
MSKSARDDRRSFVSMSLACAGLCAVASSPAAVAQHDAPDPAKLVGKRIYLVVYRPGAGWIQGKPMQEQPPLQEHGRYMLQLYRRGVLQFAGRFGDNIGGAMAFLAKDDAEADAIVAADPAVTSGMFTHELRAWELQPWADIAARSTTR